MKLDYRDLDKRAEKLRLEGTEIAARGTEASPEDRERLMVITGELNQLDELRVAARDDEIEEARSIAAHGVTVGAGEAPEEKASQDAFRSYLRAGDKDMTEELRAALVSGTDANGGYIVPEPVHGPVIEKYRKVSPLLAEAEYFEIKGDSKMFLPYKATHGAVANAAETGARSEQTEPTFSNIVLNAGEYYSDQRATQQFIDSSDGAEDMIINWIYEDFAEQFNTDIAVGAGTNSTANGIFVANATYPTTLSGAAGALANTNFNTVFFALRQPFRPNAKWYMSGATLAVLMGFAMPNLNNTPLVYTKPTGGFSILGKDVVEVDDAPAIGATAYPVAFGDLKKGYAVGVHKAVSILRDPYTDVPRVKFYAIARMGGIPWNPNAVQLLKSNTA